MKFKVTWYDEDEMRECSEVVEFQDWTGRATLDGVETGPQLTITAREWAEDFAYSAANKGSYEVTEIW